MGQFQTQIPNNTVIIDVEYYNDLLRDSMRVKNALEHLKADGFLCTEDMFRILGDTKTANQMRDERNAEREKALQKLKEGGGNVNE